MFDLDRRATYPKFDPTWVSTHDLLIKAECDQSTNQPLEIHLAEMYHFANQQYWYASASSQSPITKSYK